MNIHERKEAMIGSNMMGQNITYIHTIIEHKSKVCVAVSKSP
jgi:hypothetical protein